MPDLDPNPDSDDRFVADLDPDFALSDLLIPKVIEQLQTRLTTLLGQKTCIVESPVSGTSTVYPVRYQISPIAYLQTEAPAEQAKAAACVVEAVISQAARYRLAAVAHHAVVLQDFEELQVKHQQLQESEANLRALAAQLEERVDDQVKQIELRQRQVYEAEKLSALAQLGAGVAHEINNPLGFIQSNMSSGIDYLREISLALSALAEGQDFNMVYAKFDLNYTVEDLQTLMKESQEGVGRVARIVKDLKGFVGTDATSRQPMLMRELLDSVCNLVHPLLGEQIQLSTEYKDSTPILIDRAAFCQAIYAILLNAVQAIRDSGTIQLRCCELDSKIIINIEDNGCGMNSNTLARIFDPFFTTKPVGTGTGLGMTVCRDIIRAHGGDIQVSSEPGQGSQVQIELPVSS